MSSFLWFHDMNSFLLLSRKKEKKNCQWRCIVECEWFSFVNSGQHTAQTLLTAHWANHRNGTLTLQGLFYWRQQFLHFGPSCLVVSYKERTRSRYFNSVRANWTSHCPDHITQLGLYFTVVFKFLGFCKKRKANLQFVTQVVIWKKKKTKGYYHNHWKWKFLCVIIIDGSNFCRNTPGLHYK